jgi:signal transduction histidine kinase
MIDTITGDASSGPTTETDRSPDRGTGRARDQVDRRSGVDTDRRAPWATLASGHQARVDRIGAGARTGGGAWVGEPDGQDPLLPFAPAILAVRWATTSATIVLASALILAGDLAMVPWVVATLLYTVLRTFFPLCYDGTTRSLVVLELEIGLNVLAVAATGFWSSALVLLLINAIVIAGFARGFGFALRVAVASTLAVTVPAFGLERWDQEEWAEMARWATLLVSTGIIAGYSRRLTGEASRRHSIALDRVARLADANTLLADLHRVAQTLPASLDQGDVLESTVTRLRSLIAHDSAVIITTDEQGRAWTVASRTGNGPTGELAWSRLPFPVRDAIELQRVIRVNELGDTQPGFGSESRSAVYAPLLARGRLIGLLAVESRAAGAFSGRDEQFLRGFVEPVALAIDNARWFDRIRTVGADEERTRIARDLHDRMGQSLAYLGFEVDRMIRRSASGEVVTEHLEHLRRDIREVVGEMRDTLSDLRTDVSDDVDFASTAEVFAARLAERSDLQVTIDCDTDHRLPLLQERELWRIAQEAMVNTERHAQASQVTLRWRCNSQRAELEVTDDGVGLPDPDPEGMLGRRDSYGLIGMRERADSIGATLELRSRPGEGTTVRCFLAQR